MLLRSSSGCDFLVVGLGNPGSKYWNTRHNVGFAALDALANDLGTKVDRVKFQGLTGQAALDGLKLVLLKPTTYMNLSGGPVRDMANYFKIDPETEMIVIYDDIDTEPGNLRIRKQGSAGGHNGIKDIIKQLGTQKFTRIRIGVGAKPQGWDLADYVLGRFDTQNRRLVDEAQERACKAVEMILSEGVDAAMNEFNRKSGVV